jgi:putative oxidoreductase
MVLDSVTGVSVARSLAGLTALRIICGLFFLPHAIGKFTAREAAYEFFSAAGFKPAPTFARVAIAIELLLAALLVSGLETRPVAWVAGAYLLIAAGSVLKVEKKWLWHLGGCEYPLFWALCCGVVGFTN